MAEGASANVIGLGFVLRERLQEPNITVQNIQTEPNTRSARLWFVNYVRVFLTSLVIAHHAGQPYGPMGGKWLIFNPE